MIELLAPALLVSLVLLGIHSYFGIRIIRRNIIFTDLAIGQMAAFGAAISLFVLHGEYLYPISLAVALVAGGIIAVMARRTAHVEAFIGLCYAMGLSGVFILLAKSPHGMEEFQNLMAYDILYTKPGDIGMVAALYAAIGAALVVIEKKTDGFANELLFFLTFAVTVTSSVKMAGVLVVFAILLAPAYIAIQLAERERVPAFMKRYPLIVAWIVGTLINTAAIAVSYRFDFPTGYTVVFCNAFAAVAASFFAGGNSHRQ